jgi:excisionase family DNA binding protein
MQKTRGRKREHEEKEATGAMLTVGEASCLLHVHNNTLRRWNEQGLIKAYRIGARRDRRFKKEDINALLLEQTEGYARRSIGN